MEQRLVKIADWQLASMIKYRQGADPIYEEIQFMILLALKELEAYRACFPLELAQCFKELLQEYGCKFCTKVPCNKDGRTDSCTGLDIDAGLLAEILEQAAMQEGET